MQFSSIFAGLAAISAVAAVNLIEFVQQDSVSRTVYFTPSEGHAAIPNLVLKGKQIYNQTFPESWIGNWYAVETGKPNVPGMLGEITWNGWDEITFFDVSAIVNPGDNSNVKIMYPKHSKKPLSGCQSFPCNSAYNLPDDIQTQSTKETTIVCLLGNKASSSTSVVDKVRRHARHFVAHLS